MRGLIGRQHTQMPQLRGTYGLHYASCVFEGERVYNGKVFRLEIAVERIAEQHEIPAIAPEIRRRGRLGDDRLPGLVRPGPGAQA